MLLLIVLAVLALVALGLGFAVAKFLFIVAAILALVWIISVFASGIGRPGTRRW